MNPLAYLALIVLVTMTGMLLMLAAIRKIPPGHRGVQFRLGRLVKELPPGTVWVLPLVDGVMLVDLNEQTIALPADLILTEGGTQYRLAGTFTCKIVAPIPAVMAALQARQDLAAMVGSHVLDEVERIGAAAVMDRPEQAQQQVAQALNERMSQAWQVRFAEVEFKLVPM